MLQSSCWFLSKLLHLNSLTRSPRLTHSFTSTDSPVHLNCLARSPRLSHSFTSTDSLVHLDSLTRSPRQAHSFTLTASQDLFALPQTLARFAYQHSTENSTSNELPLTLPSTKTWNSLPSAVTQSRLNPLQFWLTMVRFSACVCVLE